VDFKKNFMQTIPFFLLSAGCACAMNDPQSPMGSTHERVLSLFEEYDFGAFLEFSHVDESTLAIFRSRAETLARKKIELALKKKREKEARTQHQKMMKKSFRKRDKKKGRGSKGNKRVRQKYSSQPRPGWGKR